MPATAFMTTGWKRFEIQRWCQCRRGNLWDFLFSGSLGVYYAFYSGTRAFSSLTLCPTLNTTVGGHGQCVMLSGCTQKSFSLIPLSTQVNKIVIKKCFDRPSVSSQPATCAVARANWCTKVYTLIYWHIAMKNQRSHSLSCSRKNKLIIIFLSRLEFS